MRIPFGDYAPDLADLGNPGLIQADGCVPEGIGYGPQKGGVAATAIGDPAVFVSVDAMHQGPHGGGPVIAIVDLGE